MQNEIEQDNIGSSNGKINVDKNENEEDVTKYGEFVSSYFAWLTPERQKKRAKEIDNMTKQRMWGSFPNFLWQKNIFKIETKNKKSNIDRCNGDCYNLSYQNIQVKKRKKDKEFKFYQNRYIIQFQTA